MEVADVSDVRTINLMSRKNWSGTFMMLRGVASAYARLAAVTCVYSVYQCTCLCVTGIQVNIRGGYR